MTHHMINGFITGIAVVFGGIIIAAIVSGAGAPSDPEPAAETTSMSGYEVPVGVGGAPAGEGPDTSQLMITSGTITDAESGDPISDVSVTAKVDGAERASTTTGSNGEFELMGIPPDAMLVFSRDGYHTAEEPAADGAEIALSLEPTPLEGAVFASDGNPLEGATVSSGDQYTRTDGSGRFVLEGDANGDTVIAKAAGYETKVIPREEYRRGVTLRPASGKGIYVSAETIASGERLDGILDMIERTELNALVVDIKDNEGSIHFDSEVELASEIDAVRSTFDAEAVVQKIKDRDITAVARIAVFEDPALAEARPELAIHDTESDEPWATSQGRAWANPYSADVWEYNTELIQEVTDLGFDQVHLSYVHFPTDGPLDRADYGQEDSAETRQAAINEFLDAAYAVSGPTQAVLSADLFRSTLLDGHHEQGGQELLEMTERLDYVHPMLYPAHFPAGSLDLEQPGDEPYEVVRQSLEHLPSHLAPRVRPWLQDFSFGSGMRYSDVEVREQIDAAEDSGASGWLLWNSENYYHENALEPAE